MHVVAWLEEKKIVPGKIKEVYVVTKIEKEVTLA